MSRRAQATFPLVVLLIGVASLPWWWRIFVRAAPSPMPVPALVLHAPNSDLDVALRRAGIDPQALAAAGVSSQAGSTIVQAAGAFTAQHPSDLTSADTAFLAAKPQVDRLQRKIQSGTGSSEDVTSYQQQNAALSTATAQRQATLDALWTAATAGLTDVQRTALTRIRANKTWELPIEFGVVERSQEAWVELRSALANERFCAKHHETPDEAAVALLATVRSNASVAAAKSSLDANAPSVTAAWNSALGE